MPQHPLLHQGSKGREVELLQRMLNKGTAHLRVDGEFGRGTERAVIAYQARHLLTPDGEVGPHTWEHLNRGPHKHKLPKRPMRVRALQHAYTFLGVEEQGGNNRGPVVSRIIRANGGVIGEPWCGDFVAICYRMAGSKAVNRSWASVYYLGRVAGLYSVRKPLPGDIVRYSFDHTGLFEKWLGNGYFHAIEGNTGDSGEDSDSRTGGDGVHRRRRHTSQVNNFRRVSR